MPPFSLMLADAGKCHATLCAHLGITLRTLQRYIAQDHAPRAVMISLWVESRWGHNMIETQIVNERAAYYALAHSWERHAAGLRRQLLALEAERSADGVQSANSPFFTPG